MKKLILIASIAITLLASCTEKKPYNTTSIIFGDEVVISDENLVKGDTVRIGYDLAGNHIASKDMSGSYIGHIAVVK